MYDRSIFRILALAVMILGLAACQKQEEPQPEKSAPPAPMEQKTTMEQQKMPMEQQTSMAEANATGKKVYEETCAACHANGVAGAPKFGVKEEWEHHLAEGKEHLVQNAINGIGQMPPKGGNAALSEEEVRAAVDYMLDQIQ